MGNKKIARIVIESGLVQWLKVLSCQFVVNPFTGFILSDFYLSTEIDGGLYRNLNKRSKNIRDVGLSGMQPGATIYCQVDELDLFAQEYLPLIQKPFVLITGKKALPTLLANSAVTELLQSDFLMRWFSQNQIYPDLDIEPFPYGVHPQRCLAIWSVSLIAGWRLFGRSEALYVPFARVHEHLGGEALASRVLLGSIMDEPVDHLLYLARLMRHRAAVSPSGDRKDTYRHYECVAMGTFPITDLDGKYRDLFGDNMIYLENFEQLDEQRVEYPKMRPDRKMIATRYWRRKVTQAGWLGDHDR